jgi:hypothetical protein
MTTAYTFELGASHSQLSTGNLILKWDEIRTLLARLNGYNRTISHHQTNKMRSTVPTV